MKQVIIILTLGLTLTSCRQNEVDGIFINHTLYENQSFADIRKLKHLIRQTLNKDEKSLSRLLDFPCGSGSGCYDLGFIITQIIYKIDEKDFIAMVLKLESKEIKGLENFIMAGLEYGDNDKDGEMDNKRIETEFPGLLNLIKTKLNAKQHYNNLH